MDNLETLEYPMYQALWRIKHDGQDALAIECPDAPILLFIYRCDPGAEEPHDVRELVVQEKPPNRVEVGWFYQMDRALVRHICTSEKPLLDAKNVEEWVGRVTAILLKREIIFWEGDDEKELISFGALDEPVIQLEPPSIEEVVDLDEITYDSGSEDMDIEWF
ncbi:hypothetical protein LMH87_000377 [Akanthomyces muscarius]|uniref:Uncharacterized protein n=1 Tax=Akanthomyces muscarius TaxID=2231603 RepID=A0A9W8QHT2_AKAMU|nr:hypothetical protein LMH87_000377 [Akanthomyces muscarius]KAJ4155113.1 hypothetical protein LMH87_000377 [Akanthomyces muscarius]